MRLWRFLGQAGVLQHASVRLFLPLSHLHLQQLLVAKVLHVLHLFSHHFLSLAAQRAKRSSSLLGNFGNRVRFSLKIGFFLILLLVLFDYELIWSDIQIGSNGRELTELCEINDFAMRLLDVLVFLLNETLIRVLLSLKFDLCHDCVEWFQFVLLEFLLDLFHYNGLVRGVLRIAHKIGGQLFCMCLLKIIMRFTVVWNQNILKDQLIKSRRLLLLDKLLLFLLDSIFRFNLTAVLRGVGVCSSLVSDRKLACLILALRL